GKGWRSRCSASSRDAPFWHPHLCPGLLWIGFIRKLSALSVSKGQNGLAAEDICLACGLCCNGVIFADVKLLPEENVKELLSLGMPLLKAGAKRGPTSQVSARKESWKFLQPCAAH